MNIAAAASCTIVICTRNRADMLDRCLGAVSQIDYPNYDILVVDNAPDDEGALAIARKWHATYLVVPIVGLSRARNVGARWCQTDVVAFIDDDAVPERNWLRELMRGFADPAVIAVTGQIVSLTVESDAERFCAQNNQQFGTARLRFDRTTTSWFLLANFGGIGNGLNMAFRRCAFEMWPGFDERLGRGAILYGGEESHAFFRLIELGCTIEYRPQAIVRHPHPRTLEELRARLLKDHAAATAYITLLLVEAGGHRWTLLRFIARAFARRVPAGRLADAQPRIVSRPAAILARLRGPLLYMRARLQRLKKAQGASTVLNPRPQSLCECRSSDPRTH